MKIRIVPALLVVLLAGNTAAAPGEKTDSLPYQKIVVTQFGGPEVLELKTFPSLPEPGPGEVRIRVEAASVSFTDIMLRKGIYFEQEEAPFTPGYDLVGVVDKTGPGVKRFQAGERVAGLTVFGGYTQYAIQPEKHLVKVPAEVDAAEAVTLVLAWTTAYQLLHREAKVKKGQTILVHGASGAVGSALSVLARLRGARVLGTASKSKHEYVRSLGVEPIDYRTEDFVARALELTEGRGVDAAFDFVSPENFDKSFDTLAEDGKLVLYGNYKKSLAAEPEEGSFWSFAGVFWDIFWWNTCPNGGRTASFYSITGARKDSPENFREDLGQLMEFLKKGKIKPFVYQRLPLAGARQAHQLLEKGKVRGKIVLEPIAREGR